MKIIINGTLHDTEKILNIGDINFLKDNYSLQFYFTIKFINGNSKEFCKKLDIEHQHTDMYWMNDGNPPIKMSDHELVQTEKYREAYLKISEFRNDLIKIWSNNQAVIPQFNLK